MNKEQYEEGSRRRQTPPPLAVSISQLVWAIADRQTPRHRETDTLFTKLRSPIGGGVTNKFVFSCQQHDSDTTRIAVAQQRRAKGTDGQTDGRPTVAYSLLRIPCGQCQYYYYYYYYYLPERCTRRRQQPEVELIWKSTDRSLQKQQNFKWLDTLISTTILPILYFILLFVINLGCVMSISRARFRRLSNLLVVTSNSEDCWHCSHSMRCRVYVTVRCLSVTPSACLCYLSTVAAASVRRSTDRLQVLFHSVIT